MAINEADLAIVSEIADLAIKLGPAVYDAIAGAIHGTVTLTEADLPLSSAAKIKADTDKMIAAKFPAGEPT